MALVRRAEAVEAEQERRQERRADHGAVGEHLGEPARVAEEDAAVVGAAVDVGEQAPELHQQREGHEHADRRQPAVAECLVREARRPERGRDRGEQHDRARLRDPERDEPMRAVVAPALGDRPAVEQAHDRDERRVEDRHREHEHRQQERHERRRGDGVARRQTERREQEPDQLRAAVAHPGERALARPQVERQEAEEGGGERQREDEDEPRRLVPRGGDREERRGDRGEARCETVHVVEEVEGVRHPDQPHDAERDRDPVPVHDLHRGAGRQDDRRRRRAGRRASSGRSASRCRRSGRR